MDLPSLSLGLAAGAAGMGALAGLREHRTGPRGLSDLLLWGFMVDHGTMLQTDGSLLSAFRYRGPDLAAATPTQANALAWHVNDALLPLTDNWMVHVDAIRRPASAYPACHFPDPITQLIDDERRAAYERDAGRQFETDYVLVLTHLPPPDAVARAARLFLQTSATRSDRGELLGHFHRMRQRFEQRLRGHLELVRLDSDELLTHLHECLTGLAHPVATPPLGAYLNQVLVDQDAVGGFEPRIGGHHLRVVAVQGYPHRLAADGGRGAHAPLGLIDSLPLALRWSTRIIPLGQAQAARLIRRHQLQWFKKRKSAAAWALDLLGGPERARTADDQLFLDQDARAMAQDAAHASAENAAGLVRFCFATQVVLVMEPHRDRADQGAREILKAINDAGFGARIETVNAFEAYLGSLPGHGTPNLRRPVLSTRNLADLLPLTSVWPGLPANPSPLFPRGSPPLLWAATTGSTPFRLNLHDSDVGHTLVVGKTGAGKSVLLALLAAQFRRYPGAQVFAFDVGYSLWALGRAVGAATGRLVHYDWARGAPDALRLQPLARIDEPTERVWAAEWLEAVLGLQGLSVTPPLRLRIDRALDLVARNARPYRTLTELSLQLQHDELTAALRHFTLMGHYGQLLDAGAEDLEAGRFQVFELSHLFELDQKIVVPVLLHLLRRIEQRLDGSPTLILIDEAWMALVHSLFGSRINQWLLQLRKRNAALVIATHSLAQLAQLPHRHTILDSCPTRIYLPDPDAQTPVQAAFYRDLGLNDRELAILAHATPKRHYYVTSPRGSRLFDLGLGPATLSLVGTPDGMTGEEMRRRIEALESTHGAGWPHAWLLELGLPEWAARLEVVRAAARHSPRDRVPGRPSDPDPDMLDLAPDPVSEARLRATPSLRTPPPVSTPRPHHYPR